MEHQGSLAQLRQFILGGSLTSEEHRYLKVLLSEVHVDIIGELPIELVRQIALLLDLRDLVACLAVSKRWRAKLLSTPVIKDITLSLCPSLGHTTGTPFNPNECLKILHKIGRSQYACFQSSFTKQFAWQNESYFKLDPEYHGHHEDMAAAYAQFGNYPDPEPDNFAYCRALYSNGKIAWAPKPRVIVVDSLWSRTRKVFTASTGPLGFPAIKLKALGDKLVVGAMGHLLVSWDHTTNIRQEKKLPRGIGHVATEGYRVAIILFGGDVLLWEFGGKLSTIATTPIIDYHKFNNDTLCTWTCNLCVILHPTCNRTLFLACGYADQDDKSPMKRAVYEFKDSKHIKTFEFETPRLVKIADPNFTKPRIRKVLPYRRDIIAFGEEYEVGEVRFPTKAHETFVEFDIYDRKFSARINEEFDYRQFGWRRLLEDADLDFLVRFHSNGFTACSFQPGFVF
ncbi:hypothetical protein F4804DRAFT_76461 [Jackrogersella minutella]|nr:hypothetical protein F4804DRAFT_76461 [Jackrogersella minutella]